MQEQDKYLCRCHNKSFDTKKQRGTHESGMRRLGNGPEKKIFKLSESMATPSLVGEKLDERMKDF